LHIIANGSTSWILYITWQHLTAAAAVSTSAAEDPTIAMAVPTVAAAIQTAAAATIVVRGAPAATPTVVRLEAIVSTAVAVPVPKV
jgi:hypothetical protein